MLSWYNAVRTDEEDVALIPLCGGLVRFLVCVVFSFICVVVICLLCDGFSVVC